MITRPNDVGKCPHCSEKLRFEKALFQLTTSTLAPIAQEYSDRAMMQVHGAKQIIKVLAAGCPDCGKPIVSIDTQEKERAWLAYPLSPLRPVPKEVEDEDKTVAEDYREASLLLTLSQKASAALSRRCLQTVLVKKAKVNPKAVLADQIQELLDRKGSEALPGYIAKNVDAIRQFGNFGAHPTWSAAGEIVEVEEGEVEWSLEILENLLDHYYVKPAQYEKRQADLSKKLKKAGKPPMKGP